jgi:hypothetical protein
MVLSLLARLLHQGLTLTHRSKRCCGGAAVVALQCGLGVYNTVYSSKRQLPVQASKHRGMRRRL